MKRIWIGLIVVVIIVVGYGVKITGCGKSVQSESFGVSVPKDSNFIPVQVKSYRPSSLPFSKKSSGVKLPKGVRENNVKQVISLELKHENMMPDSNEQGAMKMGDLTWNVDVIETKTGDIFVAKDSLVKRVMVTRFEPQLFRFGMRVGLGCSIGFGEIQNPALRILPMGVISLAEWNINKVSIHAPLATVDFDGVGIGFQTQLYHDIYVGLIRSWNYSGGGSIKVEVGVMF